MRGGVTCSLLQAKQAHADEALMLDPHGFVATCNSTNFFVVRKVRLHADCARVLHAHVACSSLPAAPGTLAPGLTCS